MISDDVTLPVTRGHLISSQKADASLKFCYKNMVSAGDANENNQPYFLEDNVLMRQWFSRKAENSDWSNFKQIVMPLVYRRKVISLGIKHVVSSVYHPVSQGAIECWYQTLKNMRRKYCCDTGHSWDDGVPFVLLLPEKLSRNP